MRSEASIMFPAVSDDKVSADLRWLTEQLAKRDVDISGGLLGGEFGYGAKFANDTFEMNPFYWGDCECGREAAEWDWFEAHDHTEFCYQQEIRRRGFLDYGEGSTKMGFTERSNHNHAITDAVCAEMGLDPEHGSYVHCTCSHDPDYAAWLTENPHDQTCGIVLPNFRHHESGSTVNWYKYIGRGMEFDIQGDWHKIIGDCIASLGPSA